MSLTSPLEDRTISQRITEVDAAAGTTYMHLDKNQINGFAFPLETLDDKTEIASERGQR